MKRYKIKYWLKGNIFVVETEALSVENARVWFNMTTANDDIISITELT